MWKKANHQFIDYQTEHFHDLQFKSGPLHLLARRNRTWERLEIMVGFIRLLVIHEVVDKLNLNSLFVACRPLPPSWVILEFTRGRYINDKVRGICKEYLTANYLCLGCTIGIIGHWYDSYHS